MPPPRNILICFDAFGTLFTPQIPIAKQYGNVARSFGLKGFNEEDVGRAFRIAFKNETKRNPNYGKWNGLDPEMWWSRVITNTFKPLIPEDQSVPHGMVTNLLHRFWCDEGYTLFPDVPPLIRKLREAHQARGEDTCTRVVIGVITNSDDRVPDVLSSLGMKVSALRYGNHTAFAAASRDHQDYDIHFSVMSYDVGHEKPDQRIFQAAEEVLSVALDGKHDVGEWQKVYVGDEFDKDVVGALGAGWKAVLIDRECTGSRDDLKWLDGEPVGSLYEVFDNAKAVGFSSLDKLGQWLPARP